MGESAQSGVSDSQSLWNVPYRRNANFVGREHYLQEIRASHSGADALGHTLAICGLGGVGKTQLALEYAYRHRDHYPIVWWIRGDQPATLMSDFLHLGTQLLGGVMDMDDPEAALAAIRRELDRRSNWLLLIDNVPGPFGLAHILPQDRAGHVIITSRNPNWRGVARPVPLEPLPREESIEFLQRRTGMSASDRDADRLAEVLGDLPLALEQAGACIEQTHLSLADYLERFQTHRQQLLRLNPPATDYADTVATTWNICFDRICGASRHSADLLNLMSFLCPDEIRRDLLMNGRNIVPYPLREALSDRLKLDGAIASLLLYSLIEATGEAVSMHRLVAAVTRDRMSDDQRRRWVEIALRLVNDAFAFESMDVATWSQCSYLLPHVISVAEHAEALGVSLELVTGLLNQGGRYLLKTGQFHQAKDVLERAMAVAQRLHGDEHPSISSIANNLGRAAMRLGDLKAARAYYEQALAIDQRAYGHDDPRVAAIVNNYGMCLLSAGDVKSAREQFEWALAVYERHLGPDHGKLASIINNLGFALRALGDMQSARTQFARALQIARRSAGEDHPAVGSILLNLGSTLRALGDGRAARPCLERAFAIARQTYAPTHPDVIRAADELGLVLRELGDLPAARSHYHRAMTDVKQIYGGDHPRALALMKAIEIR